MGNPKVAIVGAGAAGCYAAQAIRKTSREIDITIFDKNPFPYGLIRYGVAADHQGTKAVTGQFERMFARDDIQFAGGVGVGTEGAAGEIPLNLLLEHFDLVIWATGCDMVRRLDVDGEDLPGVHDAGEVARAWNADPAQRWEHLRVDAPVAVVGAGNVALDILRLLVKEEQDLTGSDLDEVFCTTRPAPIDETVCVVRADPQDVRWDVSMIRELVGQERTAVSLSSKDLSAVRQAATAGHQASGVLLEAAEKGARPEDRRIRFLFATRVIGFHGDDRVNALAVESYGERETFACRTAITAIGFLPAIVPAHERLVTTGWAATGPRGAIPTHRAAARQLAAAVVARLPPQSQRQGIAGVGLVRFYSYDDWRTADAHEVQSANPGRVRRKIRDLSHLQRIVSSHTTPEPMKEAKSTK